VGWKLTDEQFDKLPLDEMLRYLVQNIIADGISEDTTRQLVTYLQCAGYMELTVMAGRTARRDREVNVLLELSSEELRVLKTIMDIFDHRELNEEFGGSGRDGNGYRLGCQLADKVNKLGD